MYNQILARCYLSFLVLVIILFTKGCANLEQNPQIIDHLQKTVILVSFDGFRWDYFQKSLTPYFDSVSATGVKAKALIPAFPTKTFPNHYTIVTGLFPENHGIIANKMYDPQMDATFSLRDRDSVEDSRWWGGEPIWVTAEKQGQTSATLFWPGSEAEIQGIRPTYWEKYNPGLGENKQVEMILDWLDLPVAERPTLITLYFNFPDSQGHRYGPNSQQVKDAIQKADTVLGWLLDSLTKRGILEDINIIITSDHGMTEIKQERTIFLDDYIDLNEVDVIDWSPVLTLRPHNEKKDKIYNALVNAHPHLTVYYKEDIPERFHFRQNPRITPIIGIADEGWSISSHDLVKSLTAGLMKGSHGYDNQLPSMSGIFIASGPAFKEGLVVEPFESIEIYNLIAEILGLEAAPNDGRLEKVQEMLKAVE